jgi:hypothetical protein
MITLPNFVNDQTVWPLKVLALEEPQEFRLWVQGEIPLRRRTATRLKNTTRRISASHCDPKGAQ